MATVTLQTQDGRHYLTVLDANEAGGRGLPEGIVTATADRAEAWEQFEIVPSEFGGVGLKSWQGKFVSALDPDECAKRGLPIHSVLAFAEKLETWESWTVVPHNGGVALRSHWGLFLSPQNVHPSPLAGGGAVLANGPEAGAWERLTANPPLSGGGSSGGDQGGVPVRQIQGQTRVIGRSFGDASGPRILHGCSDFGAIARFHYERDNTLRGLDVMARYQQYVRVLWRLNGPGFWDLPWPGPGGWPMSVDPIRDAWFEDELRGYLTACHERGIRVNLTSGDMFNWTDRQAEEWFARVAQIAASVSPDVVWLSAAVNEMRGTTPGGESAQGIAKLEHLMRIWAEHYPWGMRSISDPGSQDKAGMRALSGGNSTCALIHDVRWSVSDAIRRAFNSPYENYPDKPIVQDEPTGADGVVPKPFGHNVYQPVNDEDDLLAIYSTHIFTGQASTFFGDAALIDRQPLDSNWGFKEMPTFWRQMNVPEDIGQGRLYHGGRHEGPMNVIGSNAERSDASVINNNVAFGVISGGSNWRVKSRWDAQFTAWTAKGVVCDERVSTGQTLPIAGPTPTVVRFVR